MFCRLAIEAVDPTCVVPFIVVMFWAFCGTMGRGAMDRAEAADWYEKVDCAEFVDHIDA